jgi:hypothetical protein
MGPRAVSATTLRVRRAGGHSRQCRVGPGSARAGPVQCVGRTGGLIDHRPHLVDVPAVTNAGGSESDTTAPVQLKLLMTLLICPEIRLRTGGGGAAVGAVGIIVQRETLHVIPRAVSVLPSQYSTLQRI